MAHELNGVLVPEIVGAFDGIVGVPVRLVFLEVAERRSNAALRRAGVRACGIQLADDRGLRAARGVQACHQSGAARADHHHIELMQIHVRVLRFLVEPYAVQMTYTPMTLMHTRKRMLRMRAICRPRAETM